MAFSAETVTDWVFCDANNIPDDQCLARQQDTFRGGNPELDAETSESWNLGAVFEPIAIAFVVGGGSGGVRAGRIAQAWADQKVVREIMVFLHSHGVGTARAVRIFRTYGNDAVQVMAENPYRLARDIRGIGFLVADGIARTLGIAKDSELSRKALPLRLPRSRHRAFRQRESKR